VTGLAGAVVIVTGAGSGIGRAAVSAFSAAGAHVLATGRSSSRLEETAALAKAPELVTPFHCDVTNEDDVSNTVAFALNEFGRLDCAFNNAGTFGRLGPLHQDDGENFNTVVDTNLRGVWLSHPWWRRAGARSSTAPRSPDTTATRRLRCTPRPSTPSSD
jgi:NAD(P)-dependent dehydrogenase (short-subunit alcohol dehydrogenase family)